MSAFFLFGFFHSWCAQESFKHWLERRLGRFFVEHVWRFLYCVLSFAALYHGIAVLHWGHHPSADTWLIAYPEWLWRLLLVVHLLSVAMLYVAFVQSDYLEFWGLRQLWRGAKKLISHDASLAPLPLFGRERLVVSGLYGWVRHPMLVGGLLFLLSSGPSKNNVVFTFMYLIYMALGAWFEERRLVRVFGADYRQYRASVGAFVPRLAGRPVR